MDNNDNCENDEEKCGFIPAFNWKRLPQKQYLINKNQKFENVGDEKILFPNCDPEIWLRSCENEILTPLPSKFSSGTIPKWLEGTLIRNGPGSLKVGKYTYNHLFDSFALLHRFSIKSGNVTYQCRFVQSDVYKRNITAQRIVFTEFGTKAIPDPCQTIFNRVSSAFNIKNKSDNAMISVYPFGDELYAFAETGIMFKINPDDLSTEKKVDLNDLLMVVNHTSHPIINQDGSAFNLGLQITPTGPVHCIINFPKHHENNNTNEPKIRIIASIPAKWPLNPSYMHSFGMTENYFILVEQPLCVSVIDLVKCKFKNQPFIGALKWFYDEKVKFTILSKKSGKLVYEFYSDPFFYLHIINQYESSNQIIIDICAYQDPKMLECMYIDAMKNLNKNPDYATMFRGRPIRFVLPLIKPSNVKNKNENLVTIGCCNAKAFKRDGNIFVEPERLVNLGCETPRINYENYFGKDYKYFYGISSDVDNFNPGTLIKVNVKTKSTKIWAERNCYPSEPIFVPSHNSTSEDDGVLLSSLLWGGKNDSNRVGLLILDAKTMQEIAKVEFHTETPIPKCLHGWFISKN
ncbi:carotenoid isomerooxygenase isoform X1 [Onthophagus taurus]|uniref:carotenoid isomerooxygenase isoform X1 n=1 Tax=Onthophagus taurus TaxID=166361 RepID=UPI0039BE90D3